MGILNPFLIINVKQLPYEESFSIVKEWLKYVTP
jgi:hypothetical protein